jgi:hypothetical protein
MRSSVVHLQDPRRAGAERDAALARMGRAKRVVTVSTLALAAAFTALADGATPAYNKKGGAVAARARGARTVAIHPSSAWPRRKHRPRRHPPTAAATPAGSAAAPASASPQPVQPPPAAPAPTQQAPATTSGGS